MEVQESRGEVPAPHWNKIKPEITWGKEGYRNSFALPMSPLPQSGTAQCQEKPGPVISPQGRVRSCEQMLGFSSYMGHHQGDLVLSHPTQNTGVCCVPREWGAAGKTDARLLESTKGTCIPQTVLRAPSGSPPRSHWETR